MEAIPHHTTTCAECGEAMPFVGPAGGCPACMFAAGSEGWSEIDGSDDLTGPGGSLPPLRYGHFEIARHPDGSPHELGRGAMGISYLARDTMLDCRVALKVIAAPLSTKADARARFRREARAAAKLRHPNVASVFHYGEQEGHCFYAMEFVEGETLDARVKRDGPLPPALALEIAAQIARALVAAEGQGIIHRDLKPSNLMLHGVGDGTILEAPMVKVIDFGLAKAVAGAADQTRGFIGTPAFASPEQFTDADSSADVVSGSSGRVDTRSDIYSLGVTLWFLLTGKTPFVGRSLAEIHARQTRQPLPLEHLKVASVPAPVVALLCRMLAADPAERPQTPRELVEQIRRCQSDCQTPSPGPGVLFLPWRWYRPVGAVIALLLAAFAVAGVYQKVRKTAAEMPPSVAPIEEKSVAVLPFENLSDDKENAFFADGIQADVIASLAKIRDLKVIGRSSVMGSRGATGAERLREIARTLGVHSLLEGTVRRANGRVVVSVYLTDPQDGRQLWGETYDRTLRDALSLQGEVARAVANALQVRLSPEEKTRLERPPTDNADAYALYLRGEALYKTRDTDDARAALPLLEQAIKLDPAFALARAKLALTLATIYFKTDKVPLARFEAEAMPLALEAVRLQPDLAEAHRALSAIYRYDGDRERAATEIEAAYRLAPNDGDVLNSLAVSHEETHRYPEARTVRERLVTLDPQDAHRWQGLYNNCRETGDYAAAARALDRMIVLRPDDLAKLERVRLDFYWKGDLEPLRLFFRDLPETARTQSFPFPGARGNFALWSRDYAAAERNWEHAIAVLPTLDAAGEVPDAWHSLGVTRLTRNGPGDAERAREAFENALPGYRATSQADPGRGIFHANLAETLACLGRDAEARAEAEIALALMVKPTETRPHITAEELAVVYARLKDADRALPLLEKLVSTPPILSVHKLRFGVEWDPIRGDPRFEALVRRGNPVFTVPVSR